MGWADTLVHDGVLHTPVIIDSFRAVQREDFVPESLREAARNTNAPLPLGWGQTISQPWTVAFMLELLQPEPGQKVLDIGAGSGWQTSLLAHIVSGGGNPNVQIPRLSSPAAQAVGGQAISKQNPNSKVQNINPRGKVFAIERVPELCAFGRANVAKYNFTERGIVEWMCGDATAGLPEHAPFDRIIAAARLPAPKRSDGGQARLKDLPDAWRGQCVTGGSIVAPIGESIWKFSKTADGKWEEREYKGFSFVPFVSSRQSK